MRKAVCIFLLFILVIPLMALDSTQIMIETEMGKIKVEIYSEKAPVTTKNFLYYVDKGLYNGLNFFRTVTLANQPNDRVKIEVIQADQVQSNLSIPPIIHETTDKTGITHTDGTLSMARGNPGTAQSSFFICINDQPELDFGGKRNPDGQGFAAFGKVIDGMEIVRKIHRLPATGQRLISPLKIIKIYRLQ